MKIRNSRGFTLIEVLVALIILALAFSSSFFLLSTTSRQSIALKDKTAANWVGLNVIAEAQLGLIAISPTTGNAGGSSKMFDANWNWKISLSSTADKNISRLLVEVSKEQSKEKVTEVTGFMLRNVE